MSTTLTGSTESPSAAAAPDPVYHALRVMATGVVALCSVAWLHLEHANLAVWTSYMVTAQFQFTSFQKGIERAVGRGVGIYLGLVIATVFRNSWGLGMVGELLALLFFFYIHFSDRLAYTFLNAGLYLAVIMHLARSDYPTAATEGWQMFVAIIWGVLSAIFVMTLSGGESDVRIRTEGQPLLPVDPRRLWRSFLLVLTVALAQFVTSLFCLPKSTTLVSTMLVMIAPDMHSTLLKGELRIAGAILALLYALGAAVLLARNPHFALLVALLGLGLFLAAYLTRRAGRYSYAGLQMGLVLPMVMVVPPMEFGSIASGVERAIGVVIAVGCSLFVGGLALALSRKAPTSEPTASGAAMQ